MKKLSKFIPVGYYLGVFFGFTVVWFINPEERLVNIAWFLPGLFVATFSMLWGAITMLERRIKKLEYEIQVIKATTESTLRP